MVRIERLLCVWVLGVAMACFVEAAVDIEAFIDSGQATVAVPIKGTITVTHETHEKIDERSFELEGKFLAVERVKETAISNSPSTVVTIYTFLLPAQEKGLHVLPALSVNIDGRRYRTIPSAYRVEEALKKEKRISAAASSLPLIFHLEAAVKGPTSLYPGERTLLFYRILYNRNIDLTRSVLPMVHPAHFQKIGDVSIKDYQTVKATVQELTQEVEASEAGTFQLGPSLIEGYAYTIADERKVYDSELLKSEALPVVLEVKPFPLLHQPASFNGALGRIKVEGTLESASTLAVGDEAKLRIAVRGVADPASFELPFLPCQPGFSGFFKIGDFPPLAELEGKAKVFHIEIRVLTPLVDHIPAIQFSSFDPKTEQYVVQMTEPISLNINSPHIPEPYINVGEKNLNGGFFRLPSIGQWPISTPPPLTLEGPPIEVEISSSSWWALWLLPLGIGGLIIQKRYRDRRQVYLQSRVKRSEVMFNYALQGGCFPSSQSLQWLENAFWHRLWEQEVVAPGSVRIEELPQGNSGSQIRAFLLRLQALQYGEDKSFDPELLKKEAKRLFDQPL